MVLQNCMFIKVLLKIQDRPMDFSLRECTKFTDIVLESTLCLLFKKLLVES